VNEWSTLKTRQSKSTFLVFCNRTYCVFCNRTYCVFCNRTYCVFCNRTYCVFCNRTYCVFCNRTYCVLGTIAWLGLVSGTAVWLSLYQQLLQDCLSQWLPQQLFLSGSENCVLPGNYAVSCGNFLPTFRDNLSAPSSGVKWLWRWDQLVVPKCR
jgi:hypothetical protein